MHFVTELQKILNKTIEESSLIRLLNKMYNTYKHTFRHMSVKFLRSFTNIPITVHILAQQGDLLHSALREMPHLVHYRGYWTRSLPAPSERHYTVCTHVVTATHY